MKLFMHYAVTFLIWHIYHRYISTTIITIQQTNFFRFAYLADYSNCVSVCIMTYYYCML